jgi:hypothetical protein
VKKWLESGFSLPHLRLRNTAPGEMKMIEQKDLAGSLTLPGNSMTLNRMN